MNIFFIIGLYFVPFIIAAGFRGHNSNMLVKIFLINLLVGWTIIGWFVAFYLACKKPRLEYLANKDAQEYEFSNSGNNFSISDTQRNINLQQDSLTTKVNNVSIHDNRKNTHNKHDDFVKCPYCDSTQITTNKKGYGFGKGLAGGVALGPLGLLAGGIGSKDVMVTCLSCGNSWNAGKTEAIRKELKSNEEFGKFIIKVIKFFKYPAILVILFVVVAFLYGLIQAMLEDAGLL